MLKNISKQLCESHAQSITMSMNFLNVKSVISAPNQKRKKK